jgi:hypothetical protein
MEAARELVQNWGGSVLSWVSEWGTVEVVKAILNGIRSTITTNELDRALKKGLKAASEHESNLQSQGRGLFYRCYPSHAQRFLTGLFASDAFLTELRKPLSCDERPDIALLVAAFQRLGSDDSSIRDSYDEAEIRPWMEVFTRTYFEETATFLRYQVAKEEYLTQLESCFGDVKFAGIPVAGQEGDLRNWSISL